MDIQELMLKDLKAPGGTTVTLNDVEMSSVMTGLVSLIMECPDGEEGHPMMLGAKAAGRKIEEAVGKGPSPYHEYFEED